MDAIDLEPSHLTGLMPHSRFFGCPAGVLAAPARAVGSKMARSLVECRETVLDVVAWRSMLS